jgi:hypothetical protein
MSDLESRGVKLWTVVATKLTHLNHPVLQKILYCVYSLQEETIEEAPHLVETTCSVPVPEAVLSQITVKSLFMVCLENKHCVP